MTTTGLSERRSGERFPRRPAGARAQAMVRARARPPRRARLHRPAEPRRPLDRVLQGSQRPGVKR